MDIDKSKAQLVKELAEVVNKLKKHGGTLA